MAEEAKHKYTIVELGNANRAELSNSVGLANQTQDIFNFNLLKKTVPLNEKYRMPNGGYDLDGAVSKLLKNKQFPRPIIFVTQAPYTDLEHKKEKEWYFFADASLEDNGNAAIISTHLWRSLGKKRALETYMLLMFATIALEWTAGIQFHRETTHGCLMDYCDRPKDIDRVLKSSGLCNHCRSDLEKQILKGRLNSPEVSAIKRLFHKATNKKIAFIAMPFKDIFWTIYNKAIAPALLENGWTPVTALDIKQTSDISEAIMRGIMESDLVVTDLTGRNPNVHWEFGYSFGLKKEFIILSQHKKLPFDVTQFRCIFYKNTEQGLLKLQEDIKNRLEFR